MFEVVGNGRNSKFSYRIMHVYAGGSIPASSSADAPPPPTTAPTYVGLVEDAKGATLHLGSIGKISYYKKKGGFFEATCYNIHHDNCRLTRVAYGSDDMNRRAQGRCLGLFMAWLLARNQVGEHSDHISAFFLASMDLECRQTGRTRLQTYVGSERLFEKERVRRTDEPEEPVEIDGLL